ncbi:MAG: LptE family protein [bacterium]
MNYHSETLRSLGLALGLVLGLALLSLFSCGPYSFSGSSNPDIKTVSIPIFQDQTSEFGVKEKLTDAVIDEFTRDNTLKIVDRRSADSVVEGTVLRVDDRAGSFTSDEKVTDVKIFITVSVKYEDVKKRKVLWQGDITQWGTFNPDEGPESRNKGIDEALGKIANEILNRSVSGW